MAGSFLGAAAFVLSTFSSSVNMLMMTYGIMGGMHNNPHFFAIIRAIFMPRQFLSSSHLYCFFRNWIWFDISTRSSLRRLLF